MYTPKTNMVEGLILETFIVCLFLWSMNLSGEVWKEHKAVEWSQGIFYVDSIVTAKTNIE